MDFLQQITTFFRIGFVTTGQTSQCCAILEGGLLVKVVLPSHI
jgi:hypothetical protein